MMFLLKHRVGGVLGRDRLAEGRARQRPWDKTKLGPGGWRGGREGEELQEAWPQCLSILTRITKHPCKGPVPTVSAGSVSL